MSTSTSSQILSLLAQKPPLDSYIALYKHLHAHPELSDQESETAALIARHLRDLSSDLVVTEHVGGHGLFAVLKNGDDGPTVMLRADFDALPLAEKTGLEYASKVRARDAEGVERGVMHACGHDFHITALLATAETLLLTRSSWSGTVIFLFQPAEERGTGARAMVADGLYKSDRHNCPTPDIVLGGHVFGFKSGTVHTRAGIAMSAADSFKITIHGSGGHGSMPHRCIDPVVIASHCVVKLQTIVSREVPPGEAAVVTIGGLQAGHVENVISDEAVLKLDIRSQKPEWRRRILESVKRIVRAECVAGRCPKEPDFEQTRDFPLLINDDDTTERVARGFDERFGDDHRRNMQTVLGSEDFGILGEAVDRPYCYWFYGGHDRDEWDKLEKEDRLDEFPVNHSPYFAPVIQPTLETGLDAMLVAAWTFLKLKQ